MTLSQAQHHARKIKICPLCKKPLQNIMGKLFENSTRYKCNQCDYEGAFFLEKKVL